MRFSFPWSTPRPASGRKLQVLDLQPLHDAASHVAQCPVLVLDRSRVGIGFNEAAFADIVYSAAVDAHAHVTVVEKRMQGRDHPVLLGVPETYYLKCFILRRLS